MPHLIKTDRLLFLPYCFLSVGSIPVFRTDATQTHQPRRNKSVNKLFTHPEHPLDKLKNRGQLRDEGTIPTVSKTSVCETLIITVSEFIYCATFPFFWNSGGFFPYPTY